MVDSPGKPVVQRAAAVATEPCLLTAPVRVHDMQAASHAGEGGVDGIDPQRPPPGPEKTASPPPLTTVRPLRPMPYNYTLRTVGNCCRGLENAGDVGSPGAEQGVSEAG